MAIIEYEKKIMLDEKRFIEVLNILKSESTPHKRIQINYYYDTPEFELYKKNETLRIRQKENGLQLQYKYGKEYHPKFRKCNEISIPIKNLPFSLNIEKLNTIYMLKGSLVTERTNFYLENAIISLDCNYYLGIVDYELEIEIKGDEKVVDKWCKILNIEKSDLKEENQGKYTRFVHEFEKGYKKIESILLEKR